MTLSWGHSDIFWCSSCYHIGIISSASLVHTTILLQWSWGHLAVAFTASWFIHEIILRSNFHLVFKVILVISKSPWGYIYAALTSSCGHLEILLTSSWSHFGGISWSSCGYLGFNCHSMWGHFEVTLWSLWGNSGINLLTTLWLFGSVDAKCSYMSV